MRTPRATSTCFDLAWNPARPAGNATMNEESAITRRAGDRTGPDERALAPADAFDPVVEAYKKDVDRSLLRQNLKLTPEERLAKLQSFVVFLDEVREAGKRAKDHPTGRA